MIASLLECYINDIELFLISYIFYCILLNLIKNASVKLKLTYYSADQLSKEN